MSVWRLWHFIRIRLLHQQQSEFFSTLLKVSPGEQGPFGVFYGRSLIYLVRYETIVHLKFGEYVMGEKT